MDRICYRLLVVADGICNSYFYVLSWKSTWNYEFYPREYGNYLGMQFNIKTDVASWRLSLFASPLIFHLTNFV